jgi:hypothetical protein
MLPTAWAAVVAAGEPALRKDLATGHRAGAVALDATIEARDPADGGGLRLTGTAGPVLGGAVADVVVVPVTLAGGERWAAVEAADARVTPLPALDLTRGLARLDLDDAPGALLPDLARDRVAAVGVTLAAAECAGGAA